MEPRSAEVTDGLERLAVAARRRSATAAPHLPSSYIGGVLSTCARPVGSASNDTVRD